MKTYCSSCGFKMEYPASSGKPNFCSSCGISLGNAKNAPVMNEGVAEDDDNDPVDEPTYIPHIDELQIDIQTDKLKSVSMAEIFKAASMADSRPLHNIFASISIQRIERTNYSWIIQSIVIVGSKINYCLSYQLIVIKYTNQIHRN